MKNLVKILLGLLLTTSIFAQSDGLEAKLAELSEKTNAAYFKFTKEAYSEVWSISERILSVAPDNNMAKYFAAHAGYRLLNFGLVNNDKKFLDKYYIKTKELCDELAEVKEFAAEAHVVKGGAYMMKLAMVPMEAPVLSIRVHNNLDETDKLSPNNPRGLLMRGIMAFNTPEMFGGSVDQAIELFKGAIMSAEANPDKGLINWGLEEAYAWLGQAYARQNRFDEAAKTYKKVLEIQPEFGWVKYQLLPGLEEQVKNLSLEKGL